MIRTPYLVYSRARIRQKKCFFKILYQILYSNWLTLKRWEENFTRVLDKVKGLGFDDKFIRTWKFYLKYCQGGFEARKISVSQFNFTK
ncbi:MAG: class I SAM-dependent methyltransferase [SAR324 cluster bacterium]|nr:class I SAM-dependent methyltransferase [SAR324 cluster bacterium]HCV45888.1 hypothetical protein [Deltaproteobacteria bacterium]